METDFYKRTSAWSNSGEAGDWVGWQEMEEMEEMEAEFAEGDVIGQDVLS